MFFCLIFIRIIILITESNLRITGFGAEDSALLWANMGNIESVDGQSEMKHHIMPLKVPMPDPTELEEKFAIVLVSCSSPQLVMAHFICHIRLVWGSFVYLCHHS